ncbi:MAG: hypothetical protein R2862_10180 [Thermoanaerobaculia bacterium]
MPAERPATLATAGRGYRWREESVRLLLGAVIGLLCAGLNFLPSGIGERLGPDQLSAGAMLAGTIYGVPGTLGFVACEELLRVSVLGRPSVLQAISARLLLGFAGHVLFRLRGDTGRRLPNLRSYILLLGGSAAVSVVASSALVSAYFPAPYGSAASRSGSRRCSRRSFSWCRRPVLWPHRLWRWRTPIAEERRAGGAHRPTLPRFAAARRQLRRDSDRSRPRGAGRRRARRALGDGGHLMVLLSGEGRSP